MSRREIQPRWHALACALAILVMTTVSAAHVDALSGHDGIGNDCAVCHFARSGATTVDPWPVVLVRPAPVMRLAPAVPQQAPLAPLREPRASRAPPLA